MHSTNFSNITTVQCNKSKHVYLSQGYQQNSFLYTSNNTIINVYDLNSKSVTQSWTLNRGDILTGAPCVNVGSTYTLSTTNQDIKQWHADDTSLKKAMKQHSKTEHVVHRLYGLSGRHDILVVFTNGMCALLDSTKLTGNAIELLHYEPGAAVADQTCSVFSWCHVVQVKCYVYVAVGFKKKNESLTVIDFYIIDTETNLKVQHTYEMSEDTHNTMCTQCFMDKQESGTTSKSGPSLITLFSNGTLFETKLPYGVQREFSPETSKINVDCLKPQSGAVICAIDNAHVAVIGDKKGIVVLDIHFCLQKGCHELPKDRMTHGQNRAQNQVLFIDSTLVWTNDCKIHTCHIDLQTSNIMAVLNFTRSKKQKTTHPVQDLGGPMTSYSHSLDALTNAVKSQNARQFKDECRTLADNFSKEAYLDLVICLSTRVCSLNEELCKTKQFKWPQRDVKKLVQLGLVHEHRYHMFIQRLIKDKNPALLQECLQHLENITEDDLIVILCYFLSLSDKECESLLPQNAVAHNGDGEEDMDVEDPSEQHTVLHRSKATAVDMVLSYNFSYDSMLTAVRKMSFDLVVPLIRYLLYVLSGSSNDIVDTASLLKVAEWLELLLDAHLTQLILSSDVQSDLKTLQDVIENNIKYWDELRSIQAIMVRLKNTLKKRRHPGLYCLSTLHIF